MISSLYDGFTESTFWVCGKVRDAPHRSETTQNSARQRAITQDSAEQRRPNQDSAERRRVTQDSAERRRKAQDDAGRDTDAPLTRPEATLRRQEATLTVLSRLCSATGGRTAPTSISHGVIGCVVCSDKDRASSASQRHQAVTAEAPGGSVTRGGSVRVREGP